MGFVDATKLALDRFQDWVTPQHVVFHHVPKCGGTSVGRALRKRFLLSQATVTPESSYRAFEAFTGRDDTEQMLVDVLDLREQMMLYLMFEHVRCISLHVRFSEVAYQRFGDRYKFITLLREPVTRFMSNYFWSRGRPHAHAHIKEDFETFLDTDRARRLGSAYVEYFSGLPKEADFTTDCSVSSAIKNLRKMDIVGRLDDLEEFEEQVRRTLGVRIRVGHENKMRQSKSEKSELTTSEVSERVREICAPDIAVWEAMHG